MAPDPYWRYVKKIGDYSGGGGSRKWKCNFCGYEKTGSVTRVKDHLARVPCRDTGPCKEVPNDVYAGLEAWRRSRMGMPSCDEEKEEEGTQTATSSQCVGTSKRTRVESSSMHASSSVGEGPSAIRTPLPKVDSHARGSLQSASIKASLQKQAMREATREITRLFIRCAIPFNVARTTQWKNTIKTISRIGCEWEGPSAETLRTRELKKEKACLEVQLEFLRETWKKYGCTILCDGWSDARKRHVYNVIVSCCKGSMFWKAIDASTPGLTITGAYIWEHIKIVIEEIGAHNVVQVITDNGSNCVSMGNLLEQEYPSIVWTPCASHCLDLLIEDLGNIFWVHAIFATARSMVRFVTKRPKMLAMFRANSQLEILKPAVTRFAYMFVVLERLVRVRTNLIRTISSDEWIAWDKSTTPKFLQFRRNVMNESWWVEAEGLVKTLNPIYTVLRITDMEGSTMGLLYEYMDRIGEALNKNTYLSAEKVEEIRQVWNRRWDWFHRPIHAVAHILHPLWRSEDQLQSEELDFGFQEYIQRYSGGDLEIIRRIEDDLLAFRNETHHFGRPTAKLRETQIQPVSWWEKYGACAPTLKRIALRVLSQDCSSGSCERNWSTWALFHTKKRNKLTTAQLERLVFCNANLKLLERLSASPDPIQIDVDKLDIEKVQHIPEIPQEDRDLYTLLYEESIQPAHDTRSRRHGDSRRHADEPTREALSSSSEEDIESDDGSQDSIDVESD